MELVLVIDQGTTGSQVALFNAKDLSLVAHAKVEFTQHYPSDGYVEHDLGEIWKSIELAFQQVVAASGMSLATVHKSLLCIGITNQRETVCAWDKLSGDPVARAIVWQDRRTSDFCQQLQSSPECAQIEQATGLVVDPYFSATKMRWLLKNNATVTALVQTKTLALSTIDSFLIFKLTGGQRFVSDHTNASRTMLYSLAHGQFDPALCQIFKVPLETLPEIVASSGLIGTCKGVPFLPDGLPITSCIGDQQSSLLGHGATERGQGKITFGTGSFLLTPSPHRPADLPKGLLCSVGYSTSSERTFVVEGSVFIAASALQYLRDKFLWLSDAAESERLAESVTRSPGLTVIPAFSGLGAPFWNPHARAAILGLSLGTTREHVIRATLEAIAFQNVALAALMEKAIGQSIVSWGVDGGASKNNLLMQFQSDVLQAKLHRPAHSEMTALGAAKAALHGFSRAVPLQPTPERTFSPAIPKEQAHHYVQHWQRAAQMIDDYHRQS